MLYIFAAVLLFSCVHPGSKLILDSGLPLSYFCVLYVLIRFLFGLKLAFFQRKPLKIKKTHLPLFAVLGLTGCALQFTEFKGISTGLSPKTVTFIMFSFPLWLTIFDIVKTQVASYQQILKSLFLIFGVFLIAGAQMHELRSPFAIYPIAASFFLALWVLISNKLRKKEVSPITLSFYYDAFSLTALLFLFKTSLQVDKTLFLNWLNFDNLIYMVLFSFFAGFLPNLLFYKGSKSSSPQAASELLSLEPVVSTLYTIILWGFSPNSNFWFGALLIFAGNNLYRGFHLIFQMKDSFKKNFNKNRLKKQGTLHEQF